MGDLLSVLLFAARVAIYAAVGYFVIKAAVKAALREHQEAQEEQNNPETQKTEKPPAV